MRCLGFIKAASNSPSSANTTVARFQPACAGPRTRKRSNQRRATAAFHARSIQKTFGGTARAVPPKCFVGHRLTDGKAGGYRWASLMQLIRRKMGGYAVDVTARRDV